MHLNPSTFFPIHINVFREAVADGAVAVYVAWWQEAADDAANMLLYPELTGIVHTLAFHAQAETSNTVEYYGLALGQPIAQHLFKLSNHCNHIALAKRTVATCFHGEFL